MATRRACHRRTQSPCFGGGFSYTGNMNREKSEEHLHEIKNVLQDFVERWDVLTDDEKKDLQGRAKKGLSHIDGIISYVHTAENE